MGLAWREGHILKIERSLPEVTMGKIHHVHVISRPGGTARRA
jgi:hypothetical protein